MPCCVVSVCKYTPNVARSVTLPFLINCSATSIASFTGIAKPIPSIVAPDEDVPESFDCTIPIKLPLPSNKPPPELPELIVALVWMSFIDSLFTTSSRDVAEIIPSVTVPPSVPSGLPIAIAVSPTEILEESPRVAGVRSFASTFNTAISLFGSVPISFASYSVPSLVFTVIFCAPSMTWLFVTI